MQSPISPTDGSPVPASDAVDGPASNRASSYDETPSPTGRRSRTASFSQSFINLNPRSGICAATGEVLARAPSLAELRRNSVTSVGSAGKRKNSKPGVDNRSNSSGSGSLGFGSASRRRAGSLGGLSPRELGGRERAASFPIVEEKRSVDVRRDEDLRQLEGLGSLGDAGEKEEEGKGPPITVGEPIGEKGLDSEKEEKPSWVDVTKHGLVTFWKFFLTPMGFFITIYMLNVVAWGGMLFLLLCNAAPAMCHPDCNSLYSPRRVWIEIDSQILNALFCVTGFGLIPWRFRDLYYLLSWRLFKNRSALQKLEGYHSAWLRTADSSDPSGAPMPDEERDVGGVAGEQKEGKRAPPTKDWKLDTIIWLYCWNTFLQAVLSGFMWGMTRFNRPSWSTGLFVALACIVAGVAGGMVWWETKKVKSIEGVDEGGDDRVETASVGSARSAS
ncbi:hypothetical protein RUND412_007430 [Rhizina undulata]